MKDLLGKHALFALHLLIAIGAATIIVLASRAAAAHEFDCAAYRTARCERHERFAAAAIVAVTPLLKRTGMTLGRRPEA
jgi:hypothetical protein